MATYQQGQTATNPETGERFVFNGQAWEPIPAEPPPSDAPYDFSATEMISNIPGSARDLASSFYEAVTSPIDTAAGVAKVGAGLAQKGLEALPQGEEFTKFASMTGGDRMDFRDYGEAALSGLLGRYGSVDAAKRTVEQDPVGALLDVSGVVSGAGTMAPRLAKAGAALNPANVATAPAKALAAKVAPKVVSPSDLYESAAKWPTTLKPAERAAITETALRNRIPLTAEGASKLQDSIRLFNSKIDDLIADAQATGATVPKDAVYKHLGELRQRLGGTRVDAPQNLDTINDVVRAHSSYLDDIGKTDLTAADLQQMKVGAYEKINFDARRSRGPLAEEEAYKSIARGAKEGVEELVPDVQDINRQLGELYELQPHLERAVARVDNRNLIGIDTPLTATAGGIAGGELGAAAGAALSTAFMPTRKSKMAIRLQDVVDRGALRAALDRNTNLSNAQIAAVLAGEISLSDEEIAAILQSRQ